MSAQKECSGPQWPAAVLHSSSATSVSFREDESKLEERNGANWNSFLPIYYKMCFSDDSD